MINQHSRKKPKNKNNLNLLKSVTKNNFFNKTHTNIYTNNHNTKLIDKEARQYN